DHAAAVARHIAAIQRGGNVERDLCRAVAGTIVAGAARVVAGTRSHPQRRHHDGREDHAADRTLSEITHEPTPHFRIASCMDRLALSSCSRSIAALNAATTVVVIDKKSPDWPKLPSASATSPRTSPRGSDRPSISAATAASL